MSLTRTSLSGNEVVGERTIAINLAEEAIEAVKNIRDTNYLRFATEPDECWYLYYATGATKASDCSSSSNRIAEGTYYLIRDLTDDYFEWSLNSSSNFAEIYEYDLDGAGHGIYAQKGISAYTSSATPYTRALVFSNETLAADGTTASFDLTVTVSWTSNGIDKSVSKTFTITNVY